MLILVVVVIYGKQGGRGGLSLLLRSLEMVGIRVAKVMWSCAGM